MLIFPFNKIYLNFARVNLIRLGYFGGSENNSDNQ